MKTSDFILQGWKPNLAIKVGIEINILSLIILHDMLLCYSLIF
jgi:hypothetical protein